MADEQSATFEAFAKQWAVAQDAALMAAAEVYAEAVRARLAGGYTSGRFVGTDRRSVVRSVRIRKPMIDRNGVLVARVGSNDPLARLWELGHHNRFTKRFERVEHWRLAAQDAGPVMAAAYHEVFRSVLG